MSDHNELSKSYDFSDVEDKWLKTWEEQHCFEAAMNDGRPSFSIVIPPPNITGRLHMGHALNKILKDIILRSRRMAGFNAPYIPGWDCHCLPIEHNVDKELGDKKKDIPTLSKRKACPCPSISKRRSVRVQSSSGMKL